MKPICIILLSILCLNFVYGSIIKNKLDQHKRSEFIFTTDRLPEDERYMCSIGNGHIATNIFSESVYMNGLYNGVKGESHRARIPAWNNIRILNETLEEAHWGSPLYSLDTLQDTFFVRFETATAKIEHRIYAHRYYTRAIVNQVAVQSTGGESRIKLGLFAGEKSDDINFEEASSSTIEGRTVWHTCGQALSQEDSRYQTGPSKVCAYWTDVPNELVIGDNEEVLHTFIITVDTADDVALKEMQDILKVDGDKTFDVHREEWRTHIDTGVYSNIYGNDDLARVMNGVWYYMLTSLPSPNSNQPSGGFYGLSPGGLSRGSYLRDYQGHSFWDTETWMYPYILTFHPNLAKALLDYRVRNTRSALDLAVQSNHKGVRFPWESAFTGAEVTPDCCPEVANFQHHITGCIGYAVRQYIAMTNDEEWLNKDGCELISNIAEFWESRTKFNDESGFYDIKNAMGPDEDHPNITNSVFTNVVAGLSLYLGDYASCLCESQDIFREPSYSDLAKKIALPYDAELDYHPQYEGYERPTVIKQADAILLGFPLLYKMDPSTKKNDLLYYENVTRENGPAMTWSMHTIGHLRLGNNEQAEKHFNKSYKPYFREPFGIWTEARDPEIGAVNFITGMGGFMQSILFGYGGISIYLDRLEIYNPQLIPTTSRVDIKGIKYLGTVMTLRIDKTQTQLIINSMDPKRPLIIKNGDQITELDDDFTAIINSDELYEIRRAIPNPCPLPLDLIGQTEIKKNKMEIY